MFFVLNALPILHLEVYSSQIVVTVLFFVCIFISSSHSMHHSSRHICIMLIRHVNQLFSEENEYILTVYVMYRATEASWEGLVF